MKKKKQIIYEQVKQRMVHLKNFLDPSYHFFQAAKYIIDLFDGCSSANYTWDLKLALRGHMPLDLRVEGHDL